MDELMEILELNDTEEMINGENWQRELDWNKELLLEVDDITIRNTNKEITGEQKAMVETMMNLNCKIKE